MKNNILSHTKTNRIYAFLINKTILYIVKLTAKECNLYVVFKSLNILGFIFRRYLKKHYSAANAEYLALNILEYNSSEFSKKYTINKLLSRYIKMFVSAMPWCYTSDFLNKNCEVVSNDSDDHGKLLLCTHTGDYWLLILSLAGLYEGKNYNFIVPIYEKITPENQLMYDKINFPGVSVTFLNIHDNNATLKISRMLKDPHCIVAVFYDLSCYVGGVYNGAVEPVSFLGRKAHMTTGILSLAKRLHVKTSVVTCRFSYDNYKYITEVSECDIDHNNATSNIIGYVERYIYKYPYQWHFIGYIDSYYHHPYASMLSYHNSCIGKYNRLQHKYLR